MKRARSRTSSKPLRQHEAAGSKSPLDRFRARLRDIVPQDRLAAVEAALSVPARTTFRIFGATPAHALLDHLAAQGVLPVPVEAFPGWYSVAPEQRAALTHLPERLARRVYLQNPASLLPVLALDPQPGEEVLDLAAAPGGKTLLIAQAMKGMGRIAAVEAVRARFHRLNANLRDHDVRMVQTYFKDGRQVGRQCPGRFDRVLLDAPCSSESVLRLDDPATFQYWSERKIREMQKKQWGLMRSAFAALRPGGVLVYSTCTFAPEENEAVVSRLLAQEGVRAVIEPVPLPLPFSGGLKSWRGRDFEPSLAAAVRVLPDPLFESFFVCRIRKQA